MIEKKINVEGKLEAINAGKMICFLPWLTILVLFSSWVTCHAILLHCGTLLFLCGLNQEYLLHLEYLDDTVNFLTSYPYTVSKEVPKTQYKRNKVF